MRNRDPKIALLGTLPTLEGCTPSELAEIAGLVDIVDVPAGYVLTKEGTLGTEVFIVIEGVAIVSVRGNRVAKLGPGEFIGEMAMLDMSQRSATVVAETPMKVVATDPRRFSTLVKNPVIARTIAGAIAKRLRLAEGALG